MKPLIVLPCLALVAAFGSASSAPAHGPVPASAAGVATPHPASAASAACPARAASAAVFRRNTSKVRHTVDDGDPCADPHSPPGDR